MFIPIVPVISHTTVVNKTIVYSDIVLSLKDSRNKKKIYFYSDKAISTKAWEESHITRYKPVSNSKDTNCISLYDISKLLKQKDLEYNRLIKSYEKSFNNSIHSKFRNDSNCIIYDFNYDNNELKLGFKYYNQRNEICFKKQDDDLYISSIKSPYARDILALLGNGLSALYDEFIQLSNFRKLFIYDIASNSKFLVNISKYDYDCNSNIVLSTIQGKENEIFKRIFILNGVGKHYIK